MAIQEQFISADRFQDFVDAPEYQDCVLELVEGIIINMPKPKLKHGVVTMRLALRIGIHVEKNDLGLVTAADTGFILERNPRGRDTIRGVDVGFISKPRVPEKLENVWHEIGPDLAVEVISPNNKAGDIHLKVLQLLNAGTRLVWLVYPENRTVVAHTTEGATTLHEDDTLSGGDVLPGFEITVGDIFPA
ncbi:MAG: Uma2 family endonuclease [Chloroflexota bacterium]|nr:Uma2 family endonuclease [Chloroflexota bacterium]MDE2908647.1 Uma2 family endonuclease [Chloroflexota bacterium]